MRTITRKAIAQCTVAMELPDHRCGYTWCILHSIYISVSQPNPVLRDLIQPCPCFFVVNKGEVLIANLPNQIKVRLAMFNK
ncbi:MULTISPECIES: hypothetical protein [unclassified Nostoc]|uniref:hypothetical protein n=1 Tax=unclassified Nostoc TaxID=2593658 RepID=UPI0025AA4099|nr:MULTISPECIES: hypothetical protein [unclassified Nostoc]MDM9581684.1 hypothetical protein [Nostoc sp. GT001]MDZ7947088.1 hypothetical protein [Nostoc sp. EfeVER01]MDZ7991513.1 hypothetical protein [Nostoc sp. EspVER01]